jgi:hypothetical protein
MTTAMTINLRRERKRDHGQRLATVFLRDSQQPPPVFAPAPVEALYDER